MQLAGLGSIKYVQVGQLIHHIRITASRMPVFPWVQITSDSLSSDSEMLHSNYRALIQLPLVRRMNFNHVEVQSLSVSVLSKSNSGHQLPFFLETNFSILGMSAFPALERSFLSTFR